ncbi:uncharacterized protein LOC121838204 [Ixodes scapularis]|uniref:uncharacterized protein LOC121838204 n=1 Tax=Ixodes scapularis TaxID=6945 RepID=UPI001C38537F|nr:uncharacterized protein LOC121838204 [Ixodes scapularis]
MYRTHAQNTDDDVRTCVYVEMMEKVEGGVYKFEQGYTLGNDSETLTIETLYASTYKTAIITTERQKDNAMRVHKDPNSTTGSEYQLIFSDYEKCDILRVLHGNGGADCELYVHDAVVDDGGLSACEDMYEDACGGDDWRYAELVYHESCKTQTAAATAAPSTTAVPPEC